MQNEVRNALCTLLAVGTSPRACGCVRFTLRLLAHSREAPRCLLQVGGNSNLDFQSSDIAAGIGSAYWYVSIAIAKTVILGQKNVLTAITAQVSHS